MELNKIHEAIKHSCQMLEKPRAERVEAVQAFCGSHYVKDSICPATPVNLIELAVTIYVRHLAARSPKCLVSTAVPSLRPFAADMEIALNQIPGEIGLSATLRRAVLEAIFSIGIVKVGIGSTNDNAKIGDEPFVSIVQLDDYFCDMSARSWEEVQYEGNEYWMDTEQIKDLYGVSLDEDEYQGDSTNGQAQARSLTVHEDVKALHSRVLLRDVYLVREGRMVTYAVSSLKLLRDEPWDGPEGSPYVKLWFSDVPGNLMPMPPVAVWKDLHDLENALFRKLAKQAAAKKTVVAFSGGNDEDIARLKQAKEGEGFRYNGPKPEQITVGGLDQPNLAFAIQVRDLHSIIAGNLDSLGGLSPQAGTATQEKLISDSSSIRIRAMSDATVDFAKQIFRRLAWYMWTDPVRERTIVKSTSSGAGALFITKQWTPETRDGDFLDYNFDIDVFSMQDDSPSARMEKFMAIYERVILPMQPQLEAQGAYIDIQAIFEYVGRNTNLPDLSDFVVFPNAPANERMPSGGSPHPQYISTKAPITRRVYERVNRPAATQQGRDQTLMQTLLGGNPQPAEKAALAAGRSLA